MSRFKTVDEAKQFFNSQLTREYKRKLLAHIRKTHGERFSEELRVKTGWQD